MNAKKLKKGTVYYCLIGEHWSPTIALVKAEYLGSAGYKYNPDLVFMKQKIDGVEQRFQADASKIYPVNRKLIRAILHNERQSRRIIEHDKSYNHKNAKEKIEGWILTLPKTDQKALRARCRESAPALVTPTGEFLTSKFKMDHWRSLMRLYFDYKYPMVDVPEY